MHLYCLVNEFVETRVVETPCIGIEEALCRLESAKVKLHTTVTNNSISILLLNLSKVKCYNKTDLSLFMISVFLTKCS